MNIKKITLIYVLFLTVVVVGFNSELIPKPYKLVKYYPGHL